MPAIGSDTRERLVLGLASLIVPLVLWETIPRIIALPRGVRLFVATPSQIAVALEGLIEYLAFLATLHRKSPDASWKVSLRVINEFAVRGLEGFTASVPRHLHG